MRERKKERERDGKRKETMRDYWSRHWINSSSFSEPHQIVLVYFFLQAVYLFVSYIFLMEVTIFLHKVMAYPLIARISVIRYVCR